MVSAINGASGAASIVTSFVRQTSTAQAVDVAILKKGQEVEQANGEAALRLIESATTQSIDVRV
jgi:hypothetical protein